MMLRTRYRFARLLVVAALVLCAPILPRAQEIDWTLLNGLATDIGVGPKGEAWVIGAVGEAYGYGIFHFDGANWSKLPGAAVRVAVGPTGPWIINDRGQIYRMVGVMAGAITVPGVGSSETIPIGGAWQLLPGSAKDIGVGANGAAWVVGTNQIAGGYGLYRWNETRKDWDSMPGAGVKIAVDPQGNPWVTDAGGALLRWNGSAFIQMRPSGVYDVGIGANGSVFAVSADWRITEWTAGAWKDHGWFPVSATADVRVSVDNLGNPWFVASDHTIWTASKTAKGMPMTTISLANTTMNPAIFNMGAMRSVDMYRIMCIGPGANTTVRLPTQASYMFLVQLVSACNGGGGVDAAQLEVRPYANRQTQVTARVGVVIQY